MTESEIHTRARLSITTLVKLTVRAWLMSLRTDEVIVVSFISSQGSHIIFYEFLRGRRLPSA